MQVPTFCTCTYVVGFAEKLFQINSCFHRLCDNVFGLFEDEHVFPFELERNVFKKGDYRWFLRGSV